MRIESRFGGAEQKAHHVKDVGPVTNAIPQERMPGNHDASYPAPCANQVRNRLLGSPALRR